MNHIQKRMDGRSFDQLRQITFTPDFVDYPQGSVLVEMGKTRVLCNVCVEDKVPEWMVGRGVGWLTAEYSMLPQSTQKRNPRETNGLKGRTQEIRRLIGRSLRAAVDLSLLGERTLLIDCDVIQADGGTRTASINGSYVAVAIALKKLVASGLISEGVLLSPVAAVSVGMVSGQPCLDLNYAEDSSAEVDLNVVMTAEGKFIEVQGTAEKEPYDRQSLNQMLDLAEAGIQEIIRKQNTAMKK